MKRWGILLGLLLLLAGCVRPPQKVTLTLPGNPSTGYVWTIQQDKELFAVKETQKEPDTEAVGAPADTVFELTPEKAGEVEVVFTYAREWEPEQYQRLIYHFRIDDNQQIECTKTDAQAAGENMKIPEIVKPDIEAQ